MREHRARMWIIAQFQVETLLLIFCESLLNNCLMEKKSKTCIFFIFLCVYISPMKEIRRTSRCGLWLWHVWDCWKNKVILEWTRICFSMFTIRYVIHMRLFGHIPHAFLDLRRLGFRGMFDSPGLLWLIGLEYIFLSSIIHNDDYENWFVKSSIPWNFFSGLVCISNYACGCKMVNKNQMVSNDFPMSIWMLIPLLSSPLQV